MVRFGMSELEAIQAATTKAAELLDFDEVGSLKAGHFADIIAVPNNPLTDISVLQTPVFVMKNGQVIHQVKKP